MSSLVLSLTVYGRGRSGLWGADLIHHYMSSLALNLTVCGRGRSGLLGVDLIHVRACTQFDSVW